MARTANHIHERVQTCRNGLGRYEPYVRKHLSKVYMVLGSTAAATAMGALLQMRDFLDLGALAVVAALILVLGLIFYKDNGKNYYTRLSMLYALGFCSGQTLGPIDNICSINPAIILSALTGTFAIFISLSLVALLSKQGKYLYLGGMLASVIATMALLSLLNMVFKSYFVEVTELYVSLFVFAAFIVYDTQNIVVKCRNGNRDVVQHAMDLFLDVLNIFRRLLIILKQREERKQNERRMPTTTTKRSDKI
ncbi:bax inhibitor 1-like [Drosophila ficusphila]|uniref:bax inhibitor 1-like n=1 Tax=Drosophila ficusphila TaxID=30025 RepID=UPI0007E69FA4|nr:bax inhibitor 1-like [Drosophila ficusphila]